MNNELSELLINKIDGSQLSEFLGAKGVNKSGIKSTKIFILLDSVRKGKITIEDFEDFIISQVKYSTNRIIINAPLYVNADSIFYNHDLLINAITEREKIEEEHICFNNILDSKLDDKFKLIYRSITNDDNIVTIISLCYARNVEITRIREDVETIENKEEYVWIDIFPEEEYIQIHLADNPKNTSNKLQSSAYSIFHYFKKKLMIDYRLSVGTQNEEVTLYKLYKYLTNNSEQPFIEKINPYNEEIKQFVEEMCAKLDYTIKVDDLDLVKRTQKLFERALIQRSYDEFQTLDEGVDGKLETFIFVDETGGSVKTGGNKEITIDECDVYFDTKETVHSVKRLKAIWIDWIKINVSVKRNRNGEENEIKTTNKIKVKYEAYDGFFVTHFIRKNVSKEDYDYVLPKFDEYKNKAL
ncbi:hypothetical protein IV75_GL000970 [Carnobacterium maltaromaticum]|uniref:hypothetical protein n=1 Tax=Carnobacterium maltaromaticum TaxID=2751 RepID=UPI000704FE09|nr:hypothetical protein [Carnobacterium maltaromaticum]KRN83805.1 hypothetical protein IV75_GL000970 [Carnobacterium maltaromaticum]